MTDSNTNINLAVYMERLDSYIESQTRLNDTLCTRFEEMGEELDEIKHWRTRMYGAKTAFFAMGVICVHSAVVLGSLIGIMNWFSTD